MPFLDLVRTYNALAIVHEVDRFFVLAALFRVAVSAALRRRNGCRKLPFRCRASLELGSPVPHDLAPHRCEFGSGITTFVEFEDCVPTSGSRLNRSARVRILRKAGTCVGDVADGLMGRLFEAPEADRAWPCSCAPQKGALQGAPL